MTYFYYKQKGTNKIAFKPIYGYALYDTITVSEATFPDFSNVPTTLSDPKATPEAQELQDYLASVYGKKIISGQQEIYGGGNVGNVQGKSNISRPLSLYFS